MSSLICWRVWPLAAPLVRWLEQRFRAQEQAEGEPRHLDSNVLAVPALALDALESDSTRIGAMARALVLAALEGRQTPSFAQRYAAIARLNAAAEAFVECMDRAAMAPSMRWRLARLLRQLRQLRQLRDYEQIAEQSKVVATLCQPPEVSGHAATALGRECAIRLLLLLDRDSRDASADERESTHSAMESAYEALKNALVGDGVAGRLSLAEMEPALRYYSALRRAAQQADMAARIGQATLDANQGEALRM